MSINEDGFLSDELLSFRDRIRLKYPRHFDLISRLNRFCHEKRFSIPVNNANGQQVIAACLMLKLLNDVQGAVVLIERGMAPQGRVLLRAALEALILLANICDRDDFYRSFIMSGEMSRLKLMRAIANSSHEALADLKRDISQELIDKTAQEIAMEGFSEEKVEALARQVGLGVLYDGIYRLFSHDTHSSSRSLEQYMVTDNEGVVKSFAWGPHDEHLGAELASPPLLMIGCMGYIDRLFKLNLEDQLTVFGKEALQLDPPDAASMQAKQEMKSE